MYNSDKNKFATVYFQKSENFQSCQETGLYKKSFPTFHRLQSALRSNNVAYDEHLLLKYIVNQVKRWK